MATEAIPDARHEAIVALHRAICAVEHGDPHEAENCAQTALAWLREIQ